MRVYGLAGCRGTRPAECHAPSSRGARQSLYGNLLRPTSAVLALALAACLFSVIYDVEIGRWGTIGIAITVIHQVYSVVVFPTIFFIVGLFSEQKTVKIFFVTTFCVTIFCAVLVAAIFVGVR